jgi:hypothetical protein
MGLVSAFHAFWFHRPERVSNRPSGGTYRCTECDNEVRVHPEQRLPLCVVCKRFSWEPLELAPEPLVEAANAERGPSGV